MPAFTPKAVGQACLHLHPPPLRSSDLTVQGIDIVVVKKRSVIQTFFSYNHLYQPECFYEKRYNPKGPNSKIYFYERALIHISALDSIFAN
jgi:hypothetical protein